MKTFYARIVRGRTTRTDCGSRFWGCGEIIHAEGENRVQAFLRIYYRLSQETSDIAGLRRDWSGERHMLGFSDDEWSEVSTANIRIKEGWPDGVGIQIEAIRDTPF